MIPQFKIHIQMYKGPGVKKQIKKFYFHQRIFCVVAQRANVRTMYVHCTYKPVHTDLVRITFGMKVFWTYGSVRTMYVHSRTYNVCT